MDVVLTCKFFCFLWKNQRIFFDLKILFPMLRLNCARLDVFFLHNVISIDLSICCKHVCTLGSV